MDQKELIEKILAGCASVNEIKQFSKWIEHNENKEFFLNAKEEWHLSNGYTPSKLKTEEVLSNIIGNKKRLERKNNLKILLSVTSAAAIIMVAALIGWFYSTKPSQITPQQLTYIEPTVIDSTDINLYLSDSSTINLSEVKSTVKQEINGTTLNVKDGGKVVYAQNNKEIKEEDSKEEKIIYNSIYVPSGKKYTLELSDGTIVYMNSSSSLRYPVKFGKERRDVSLRGQAYFVVAKDKKKRPFIVASKDFNVRAISTEFDVCSYPDDNIASMTMVEGKVEVSKGDDKTICDADKQFIYHRDNNISKVLNVDAKYLTQWRNGVLILDHIPFKQFINKLEMWYGIKINVNESKYSDYKFSGEFDKADLKTAIQILHNNLGASCELVDNILTIN